MDIRQTAIQRFSADNIRSYEAYSTLEDVFVPLYFFHRYQTEATAKLIGGLDYNYALKGAPEFTWKYVVATDQRQALQALLQTVQPENIAIPKDKLNLFPPRAFGYQRSRESFKSNTGVAFDALGAARAAADMTYSLLLHPERASRLVQQKALDGNQLGLEELLDILLADVFDNNEADAYLTEVRRTLQYSLLDNLMHLGAHPKSTPQVQALVNAKLHRLRLKFQLEAVSRSNDKKGKSVLNTEAANLYQQQMARTISRYFEDATEWVKPASSDLPDGSPIGSFQCLLENGIYD